MLFIKFYDREVKCPKDTEHERSAAATRDPAVQPIFLTDADFATQLDEGDIDSNATEDEEHFYTARDRLEEDLLESDDSEGEEVPM